MQCKVTHCRACTKAATTPITASVDLDCPGRHGLHAYSAPTDGISCGSCNKEFSKGDDMRGCKQCAVTFCRECASKAASSTLDCPGRHGLRAYNAPTDDISCGACKKKMSKGDDMRGCKQCAVTYCRGCVSPGSAGLDCPGAHGLRTYACPRDDMCCDQCKKEIGKGDGMYGCKTCKVTFCRSCFNAAAGTAAKELSCPGGHGLRDYAAPTNSLACNACTKVLAKGDGFKGCKACKVTFCKECFKASSVAPTEVACPKNHPLRKYNAPNGDMKCDVCSSGMVKGSAFRGCKACAFTCCEDCYSKGTPASKSIFGSLFGGGNGGPPERKESFDFDSYGGSKTLRQQREEREAAGAIGQEERPSLSMDPLEMTGLGDLFGSKRGKRESRDCSGHHGLRPYKAPNDSMVCKGCSTIMAKGADFR